MSNSPSPWLMFWMLHDVQLGMNYVFSRSVHLDTNIIPRLPYAPILWSERCDFIPPTNADLRGNMNTGWDSGNCHAIPWDSTIVHIPNAESHTKRQTKLPFPQILGSPKNRMASFAKKRPPDSRHVHSLPVAAATGPAAPWGADWFFSADLWTGELTVEKYA